jgi:leader peptidase (prepilin peptidase)/N-methyltransferase
VNVVAAVLAVLVVSPLLAGWSAALAAGRRSGWWRPRPVGIGRVAVLAAVAAVFVLLAAAGDPGPAWWLLAAGGAVLAVVDAQTRLLPARFTYPLAGAVGCVLLTAAVAGGDFTPLLRSVAAAAVIGGSWLGIRFVSPPAMGQGDVRVAALTGGLLGWTGWAAVWQGQLLIALLGAVTAVGLLVALGPSGGGRVQVPMGPAIITGALLTLWL